MNAREQAVADAKDICEGLGIRHSESCLIHMYQQQMDSSTFLDSESDKPPHRRVY
ncbi:hypothetical protein UFOVP1244_137 [uncultured Caudovirales phage]|uniref:Uncharacterized protein n=1 Tax=uncultured Caudovirales phage TaxID=2100421 RepID=A0A6J5RGX7_9CAUD|nr:hypothetical protein UFOVP1244_137 [uncultured Caudovirales phage]